MNINMNIKKATIQWVWGILMILMGCSGTAFAGSLEPSEPPGPTMKTLSQIEPRIPITDVPIDILKAGSYYLTGDIESERSGVVIQTDNVTIDLMGHNLSGSGNGTGIFIFGQRNIEIRNGTVQGFETGIRATENTNIDTTTSVRVINIRSFENAKDGINLQGKGDVVKNCATKFNGGDGIIVSDSSTITDNVSMNNGGYGIYATSGNQITDNVASNNQFNGIRGFLGNVISSNTTYQNKHTGIEAFQGNTVSGNSIYNNGFDGILGQQGNTIIGNTVVENGNIGINFTIDDAQSLVDRNTSIFNDEGNIDSCSSCIFGINQFGP